jgi:O-6-methylguanine DNA methyltransferase
MSEQANTASGSGQGVLVLPRLGAIWLAWDGDGVIALDQLADRVSASRRLEHGEERAVPRAFADPLLAFDRGEPIDVATIPVSLHGPPFFVRVWRALREVKRGHVRTYGGLARDVGSPRATRAVGTAMARNPIPLLVPCHRVVAEGSMLGGYSDGVPRKIVLLGMEGVRVDGDRVLAGQLDLL